MVWVPAQSFLSLEPDGWLQRMSPWEGDCLLWPNLKNHAALSHCIWLVSAVIMIQLGSKMSLPASGKLWGSGSIRNVAIVIFAICHINPETKSNSFISHSSLSKCYYHPPVCANQKQGISLNLSFSLTPHINKCSWYYHWGYLSWIPFLLSFCFVASNLKIYFFSSS